MSNEDEIKQLKSTELKNYKAIGTATGISLEHCLALGIKHNSDAMQRMVAFYVEPDNEIAQIVKEALPDQDYITITFYEDK